MNTYACMHVYTYTVNAIMHNEYIQKYYRFFVFTFPTVTGLYSHRHAVFGFQSGAAGCPETEEFYLRRNF